MPKIFFVILFSFGMISGAQEPFYDLPTQTYNVPPNVATGLRTLLSQLNSYAALTKEKTYYDIANRIYNRIEMDLATDYPCHSIRIYLAVNKRNGQLEHALINNAPFDYRDTILLRYPKNYVSVIEYSISSRGLLASGEQYIVSTDLYYPFPGFDCDDVVLRGLIVECSKRYLDVREALAEKLKPKKDRLEDNKEDVKTKNSHEMAEHRERIESLNKDKEACLQEKVRLEQLIDNIASSIRNVEKDIEELRKIVKECERQLRDEKVLVEPTNRRTEALIEIERQSRVLAELVSQRSSHYDVLNELNCKNYDHKIGDEIARVNKKASERECKIERIDEILEVFSSYMLTLDSLKMNEVTVYKKYNHSLTDPSKSERADRLNENYKRMLKRLLRDPNMSHALLRGGFIEDPIEHYKEYLATGMCTIEGE